METQQDGEEEGVKHADKESESISGVSGGGGGSGSGGNVVIQIRGNAGNASEPIQVHEIVSKKWLDARLQILKLLDDETSSEEKTRIVDELMSLVEAMCKGVTLRVQLGDGTENAITWTLGEHDGNDADVVSRKPRHRLPLADVNHRLFSLSDAISSVKNKMLSGRRDQQRDRVSSVVDIHVCREIHRNFRRILQKESRFLRDELFSARERIYRLERKYVAAGSPTSKSASGNGEKMVVEQNVAQTQQNLAPAAAAVASSAAAKIVPYYDLSIYHPLNFINIVEPTATALVPAHPSWNPMAYAATLNSAEKFYYHCDFYRPIPVGYEPLAVVNYNEMPPPPLPPPPPPPPPPQPFPLPPLLPSSQPQFRESIEYDRYDQHLRRRQQNMEHCSDDDREKSSGLNFNADGFSSDQFFPGKNDK